jgi:phosphatidylglycerophosphate synthase
VQRRNKLISKLWEQLELAKAKHSGKDFVVKRYKNVKDLEGNIKSIEKPKRIKPWWFTSSSGALCINVFYGSKVLELAKAYGAGLVVGTIAGLTDLADGWVARRTGQVSRLGEILDQFSDLVFEAWVLYLAGSRENGYPAALLLIYLLREFWVVTIRRFMAEYQINISSNFFGKLKTNFLMYACIPAFGAFAGVMGPLDEFAWYLGLFGMSLGILFGYIAAWDYTKQFVRGYNEVIK